MPRKRSVPELAKQLATLAGIPEPRVVLLEEIELGTDASRRVEFVELDGDRLERVVELLEVLRDARFTG